MTERETSDTLQPRLFVTPPMMSVASVPKFVFDEFGNKVPYSEVLATDFVLWNGPCLLSSIKPRPGAPERGEDGARNFPPPWRRIDPPEDRDRLAELLPERCDRERFLADLELASVIYVTSTLLERAARKDEARRELRRLATNARSFERAFRRLGPLAREYLGREADAFEDEQTGGLVMTVAQPSTGVIPFQPGMVVERSDEIVTTRDELTTHNIATLAGEMARWAEKAQAAIPKGKREPEQPLHTAVRMVALAWWIATGKRPTIPWQDPTSDEGQRVVGPAHQIAPLLLNPARAFLEIRVAHDSLAGIVDQACKDIAALALVAPPADVFAGLRLLEAHTS